MKADLKNLLINFNADPKRVKNAFKKVKSIRKKELDGVFQKAHDKVFKSIDCLDCANCCKTTSPIFRDVDIEKISKHLRIKQINFVNCYLRVDEDGDYVLKSSPCSFLNDDNTCSIYEFRPLACKGYPHTNRKNMHQIIDLTKKNTEICPAVCKVIDEISKK